MRTQEQAQIEKLVKAVVDHESGAVDWQVSVDAWKAIENVEVRMAALLELEHRVTRKCEKGHKMQIAYDFMRPIDKADWVTWTCPTCNEKARVRSVRMAAIKRRAHDKAIAKIASPIFNDMKKELVVKWLKVAATRIDSFTRPENSSMTATEELDTLIEFVEKTWKVGDHRYMRTLDKMKAEKEDTVYDSDFGST